MKFSGLKNSLKEKIGNVYLLEGDDAYFLQRAQNMLISLIDKDFKDFNLNIFYENYKITDVLKACLSLPYFSNRRVVVIFEYYSKWEYNAFLSYIENPSPETVLVIVNSKKSELKLLEKIIYVDCNREDAVTLKSWIPKIASNYNAQIGEEAVNLLIEYCRFDMARINTEIKKLSDFSKVIDSSAVNLMVYKDVDFQVYELTDAIGKDNNFLALNILESLLEKNDNSYISLILVTIFNAFKRMYYIKLSSYNDVELSGCLKIKEYAVKILRKQAAKYTIKFLQDILEVISGFEAGFKSGKINANIALRQIIFNLLNKEKKIDAK